MHKRSWTDEDLIAAVIASRSYRNVLLLLGLVPAGGNYVQVQYRIKALELDISHFTGKGWNKGTEVPYERPAAYRGVACGRWNNTKL